MNFIARNHETTFWITFISNLCEQFCKWWVFLVFLRNHFHHKFFHVVVVEKKKLRFHFFLWEFYISSTSKWKVRESENGKKKNWFVLMLLLCRQFIVGVKNVMKKVYKGFLLLKGRERKVFTKVSLLLYNFSHQKLLSFNGNNSTFSIPPGSYFGMRLDLKDSMESTMRWWEKITNESLIQLKRRKSCLSKFVSFFSFVFNTMDHNNMRKTKKNDKSFRCRDQIFQLQFDFHVLLLLFFFNKLYPTNLALKMFYFLIDFSFSFFIFIILRRKTIIWQKNNVPLNLYNLFLVWSFWNLEWVKKSWENFPSHEKFEEKFFKLNRDVEVKLQLWWKWSQFWEAIEVLKVELKIILKWLHSSVFINFSKEFEKQFKFKIIKFPEFSFNWWNFWEF